jgi:hypothetical protein
MDPEMTLLDLLQNVLSGHWEMAEGNLQDLKEWDAKGGFKPTGTLIGNLN